MSQASTRSRLATWRQHPPRRLAQHRDNRPCAATMSVLLETSEGDIVVSERSLQDQCEKRRSLKDVNSVIPQLDLEVEKAPKLCENFLKLCKTYRYNYCAFFSGE